MFRTVPLSIICFHCTHSNGICHIGLLTACEQYQDGIVFHPDPACKLSANLYDIYHCCMYNEKLMMDRGTCQKHVEFHSKNKFDKLVHLVGFITKKNCLWDMRLSGGRLCRMLPPGGLCRAVYWSCLETFVPPCLGQKARHGDNQFFLLRKVTSLLILLSSITLKIFCRRSTVALLSTTQHNTTLTPSH
jgi:hypothetical protein